DQEPATGEGLADWRPILRTLQACFQTGSFAKGAELVGEITTIAEQLNHHPDVLLRFPHVLVTTTSHDTGAVTERDEALARRISQVAADMGITADPSVVGTKEIAIDVLDETAVRPFWQAVLGYESNPDDETELSDPFGRHPTVWFHQMDVPRPQRCRLTLDVWVPEAQAAAPATVSVHRGR